MCSASCSTGECARSTRPRPMSCRRCVRTCPARPSGRRHRFSHHPGGTRRVGPGVRRRGVGRRPRRGGDRRRRALPRPRGAGRPFTHRPTRGRRAARRAGGRRCAALRRRVPVVRRRLLEVLLMAVDVEPRAPRAPAASSRPLGPSGRLGVGDARRRRGCWCGSPTPPACRGCETCSSYSGRCWSKRCRSSCWARRYRPRSRCSCPPRRSPASRSCRAACSCRPRRLPAWPSPSASAARCRWPGGWLPRDSPRARRSRSCSPPRS